MNGKYCCGFQALCLKLAAATSISRSLLSSSCTSHIMDARKGTKPADYVAKYLKAQEQNSSNEEHEEIETFEFDDVEPSMVLFRR